MSDTHADRPSLFQLGAFKLASGGFSWWQIDCDALTGEDWRALAHLAASLLPAFGHVEGVEPPGGRFAAVLQEYATSGPLLLAAGTCANSAALELARGGQPALGVCVFWRAPSDPPDWVTPLLRFATAARLPTWAKELEV